MFIFPFFIHRMKQFSAFTVLQFLTKDLTKDFPKYLSHVTTTSQVQITPCGKNRRTHCCSAGIDLLIQVDGKVRPSHMCGLPGLPQNSRSVRQRRERAKHYITWRHLAFSCDFNLQIRNTACSLKQVFFNPCGAYDRSYCTIAKARWGTFICIACFNKAIQSALHKHFETLCMEQMAP